MLYTWSLGPVFLASDLICKKKKKNLKKERKAFSLVCVMLVVYGFKVFLRHASPI